VQVKNSNKLKHYLLRIFNPLYWICTDVDWEYDKYLTELLDSHDCAKLISERILALDRNNIRFHILAANYPYACGDIIEIKSMLTNEKLINPFKESYPSVQNRKRINDLLTKLKSQDRALNIAKLNEVSKQVV